MPANLTPMTWWQYVERVAPGQTQEQIARRIGVSTPTVGRWQASTPKPASVAAFARAYGRPVLEAFIAVGFLTADDARAQVTISHVEDPSDDELLELLARRLRRDREDGEGSGQQPAPIDDGPDGSAPRSRGHLRSIETQAQDGDYADQAARPKPPGGSMRERWDAEHGGDEGV